MVSLGVWSFGSTLCTLKKLVQKFHEPYSINVRGSIPNSGGHTRIELGNLLENFKTDILGAMGSQLDALQAK